MSDEKIYKLLKLLLHIIGRLPVPVASFCSDLLGLLWFKIDKRHRNVTLDNIQQALGAEMTPFQVMCTAKQVFKNIAGILFEFLRDFLKKRREEKEQAAVL